MNKPDSGDEINLWEYIQILSKRKWIIILPTALLATIVGIYSFLKTPVWEVDGILQPSKFLVQTQDGKFEEILVVDPKQIVGQINQASYNGLAAAALNLNPRKVPRIQAENLRDTKLVRIWLRDQDIEKGKKILDTLFAALQIDLNRKIDVELQGIDTQIAGYENGILLNELKIKDQHKEIEIYLIQKEKIRQEIVTEENKLQISERRAQALAEEMKAVKNRIDDFDDRWKKVLTEQKQGADAVLMLLFSSEAQTNLRYLNTLEENLSREKNTQEGLLLNAKSKAESLKELDAQIEKKKNDIDKIKNDTETLRQQSSLLKGRKARIDYAQWVKEPTSSLNPTGPSKILVILVAGFMGLVVMSFFVLFIDLIQKQKRNP
jgi:LPS O-antigen subunit length determinant protein (WzzB/FepE family)